MALVLERGNASERMHSVRTLLTFIKSQESESLPPVDTDIVKILRGLFYVHLYGAFEKSVNEGVESYLQAIGEIGAKGYDFSASFLPIALDPRFTSLQNGDKWQGRIDFSEALHSPEACVINNTVLAMHMQNTKAQTLKAVANYLGASDLYTRTGRDEAYLDEVAEKRNQVAHGRVPPLTVGAVGRSVDLELRLEAMNRLTENFLSMLEDHINSFAFLRPEVRDQYRDKL
jgi:hypothetical protein